MMHESATGGEQSRTESDPCLTTTHSASFSPPVLTLTLCLSFVLQLVEALTGPGAAEDTVESFRALLREGLLDDREVVVDVPVKERAAGGPDMEVSVAGMGGPGATIDIGELMARLSGGGRGGKTATTTRTLKVKDARGALEEAELDRKLSTLDLRREAVTLAEQNGIVFIDEIDKLVSNRSKHSGDASSEGVQRDLLPLIEGTTIEVR